MFKNYEKALEGAGAKPIYSCALAECGPAFAASAWNRYNGLFAAADGDPRYLAAKIATASETAYVALMVGRARSQLDVVEIVGMQENLVVVDAGALGQGIDRDGRVSVYGVYFDVDKAVVKPESRAALDEIAKLLKARPDLQLVDVRTPRAQVAVGDVAFPAYAWSTVVDRPVAEDRSIVSISLCRWTARLKSTSNDPRRCRASAARA